MTDCPFLCPCCSYFCFALLASLVITAFHLFILKLFSYFVSYMRKNGSQKISTNCRTIQRRDWKIQLQFTITKVSNLLISLSVHINCSCSSHTRFNLGNSPTHSFLLRWRFHFHCLSFHFHVVRLSNTVSSL